MGYHFTADNSKVEALINMLASDKKIEILSKPHLMVLDNTEATIQIGNDVPIISSEVSSTDVSSSTTSPSVLRNVQYKSTGVLMRLKPTINAEGLVTLEISQEVSEAQTNQTSKIDSPLILKRRINTSVVAANGQTVIIGGIRSKNVDSTETKVPLLGDIPILGYVFKSNSDRVRRTELIVLITPRILSNFDDTSNVTQEIKDSFLRFK
ncbi:general secretion pathway protein D [Candidatus Magnetobacterium bavaricum]|uniref:General secretion pathway protein D n=1 Tax=Candidatus Magnetobacterium bavaricum TaxID=29290 RepID=A0A0F3GW43_9BACT|nr:general secretion pathway protein D [Candidatus Magnetobacterium bavaricum]